MADANPNPDPKTDPNNGGGDGGQTPPKNDPKPEPPAEPSKGDDDDDEGGKVTKKALDSERSKRKEAEEKLRKMEEEKAEAERKAKEEQGEYQKLYEEEKGKNETLTSENTELKAKVDGFEASFKKSIETQLANIKSEDDRKMVSEMLEPHSIDKQQELLPGLLEKFGVKSNLNGTPNGGGKQEPTSAEEISKMEKEMKEAEAKGDVKTVQRLNRAIQTAKKGAS